MSSSDLNLCEEVKANVLKPSETVKSDTTIIKGYDFNKGINYEKIFASYLQTGFQATNLSLAINEINRMLDCRNEPLPEDQRNNELQKILGYRKNCTIFLGYTSNLISSGLRDTIRFLAEHHMIDAIVTTAGGIEEDFIKCLAPTYLGSFDLAGRELRNRGINRIGNLLVPNDNYCKFEEWLMPILDQMIDEQQTQHTIWSPSLIIQRLGECINDPTSIYYWTSKHKIPVFCPAITDGSLGDMMYFHSYKKSGLVVDILSDLRHLNTMAVRSINSGMIIMGGGIVKHHICNANLMRNGADYSVFINTGNEFDGSDSGAPPDEAISWGKIRSNAVPIKVYAEATLVFPIIVAETFAKRHFSKSNTKNTY